MYHPRGRGEPDLSFKKGRGRREGNRSRFTGGEVPVAPADLCCIPEKEAEHNQNEYRRKRPCPVLEEEGRKRKTSPYN